LRGSRRVESSESTAKTSDPDEESEGAMTDPDKLFESRK
jgi:hypothetical protein